MQQLSYAAISEPEVFEGASRSTGPRELRLALSIRGGVSLAVWIGGAVAELDRLRRAAKLNDKHKPDGVSGVYSKLCDFANYESISIDVITGASAGGLNGVLYAASLVYGFDFDKIADIWVSSTDIEALSRETHGFVSEQAKSLLDGDGYFLKLVRDELSDLVANGSGSSALDQSDPRLELFLTATLSDPVKVRFSIDSFSDIVESRRAAFFHFGHLGAVGGPFSNFGPQDDDAKREATVRQLALAARASSSFPVAFEPANIGGKSANMGAVFSDDVSSKVEVIDGGTLDNIPVKKAIDAIAAAPAQGPTTRWLVYLHPSPEIEKKTSPGQKPAQVEGLRSVIGDMKRAANAAISQESLVEDLVELERHNAAVTNERAARDALIAAAIAAKFTPDDILDRDGLWMKSAQRTRIAVEASRIMTLAETPQAATINHAVTVGSVAERWDPSGYRRLRNALVDALEDSFADSANQPCLPDLLSTTGTLLGWANDLQRIELDQASLATTKSTKRRLYRLRLLLETMTSRWESAWIESTGGDEIPSERLVKHVQESHLRALLQSENVDPALRPILFSVVADVAEDSFAYVADADFHQALHDLVLSAVGNGAEPIVGSLWKVLAEISDQLKAVTATAKIKDNTPVDVRWIRREHESLESLQALAALLAPHVSRTPQSSARIDFVRLSGANETVLDEFFPDGPLSVADKLVGNELANFGAFFTAKGRANDWMWGRVDAAKTIVDVVLAGWTPPSDLEPSAIEVEVAKAVSQICGIATHPFEGTIDMSAWATRFEERWSAERTSIEEEVRAYLNGDKSNQLIRTKRLLIERIQAELLAHHQPWVDSIGFAADTKDRETVAPAASPAALCELLDARHATVGDFRIPNSITPARWASIGMRLGLVGWRALTGRTWGVVLFVLKPLYLYVLAIAVQPRRALFSGMIGFGALAIGDWDGKMELKALWSDPTADPEPTWQRIVAWVMVLVSFGILGFIERRGWRKNVDRKGEKRTRVDLLAARVAAAVVVLVAVTSSLWPGWVAPPIVVVAAGAIVATLLFSFMRPSVYVAGVLIVIAIYVGWAAWSPNEMSRGWWAFSGYVTVTYALTFALSIFDVFRPKPRRPNFRSD